MKRRPRPPLRNQRGEINWPRLLTVCAILAALLVVPMVMLKNRAKARAAAAAIERAPLAAPPAPSGVAEPFAANNPERFGLTFGWMPDPASDRIHASCHGEPRGVGQPHRDSCNPYRGDTSCRTALPLLCARAAPGDPPYALATAPAVAGFLLTSLEDANARCAASLGAGWRLASFHDGGGWELHGQGLVGTLADRRLRAWVFIGDQPGNCWDKP